MSGPKNEGTHSSRKLGQSGRGGLDTKVSLPKKKVSIAGREGPTVSKDQDATLQNKCNSSKGSSQG